MKNIIINILNPLNIINKKKYFAEIVNESGETIDRKEISEEEIESQIIWFANKL